MHVKWGSRTPTSTYVIIIIINNIITALFICYFRMLRIFYT